MAAFADPLNVGTYNVEKALYYLGPQNYGAEEPDSCCGHIGILIQNLVMTILRIINFIFGDHQWYNNETAIDIVAQYYRGPAGTPELANKIDELYQSLRTRGDGCCYAGTSYADRIDIAAARRLQENGEIINDPQPEGLRIIDSRVPELQNPSRLTSSRPSTNETVVPGTITRTGNISLKPIIDRLKNQGNLSVTQQERKGLLESRRRSLSAPEQRELEYLEQLARGDKLEENEVNFFANDTEQNLKNYTVTLEAEGDEAKQMYQAELEIIAPRKGQPGIPNEPQIETPLNDAFKDAADPYELIKAALLLAFQELGISTQTIQHPGFSVSPTFTKAMKLAIYLIVNHSQLKTDDCEGPYIKPNEHIKTRYQKPSLVYTRDRAGRYESQALYNVDLFSSTTVGCDPDGAKRLMQGLAEAELITSFKTNFVNGTPLQQGSPEKQLEEVLTTMVEQAQLRYGVKALEMAKHALNRAPAAVQNPFDDLVIPENSTFDLVVPFDEYIRDSQTPYQLILKSLTWSAQKFASSGLINEDDLYGGEAFEIVRNLICRNAVLRLIVGSRIQSEFSIKFSNHVTIELGRYFAHEPTSEDPAQLKAKEYFIPTDFGGKGTDNDPSSDPLRAKAAYSRLSDSDKALFEEYYLVETLYKLYVRKGIPPEQMREIEVLLAKFDLLPQQKIQEIQRTTRNFASIPAEKLARFRDIVVELNRILDRIKSKHFSPMLPIIMPKINIPEDARPTMVSLRPPVQAERSIMNQPVQLNFLPAWCRGEVKVDTRPKGTGISRYPLNDYRDFRAYGNRIDYQSAIQHQNDVINNSAACGNCMYGALALEIFGNNIGNVDRYAWALREAVSNYMLDPANRQAFLPAMIGDNDRQAYNESNEAYERRYRRDIEPVLLQRLNDYCNQIKTSITQWGGGIEQEAIAAIFGVQIHVFKQDERMEIVDKTIQPNVKVGSLYDGKAPIRVKYSGAHYEPIHLK